MRSWWFFNTKARPIQSDLSDLSDSSDAASNKQRIIHMDINFDPKLLISQASAPDSLEKGKTPKNPEALRRACQDFEAVMLQSMLKSMRSTVPDDGLLEKDNSRDIFDDLFDQEIATQIARTEGVGIGDMLFRQLQKLEK
jgi:flagellar protein FlgJ